MNAFGIAQPIRSIGDIERLMDSNFPQRWYHFGRRKFVIETSEIADVFSAIQILVHRTMVERVTKMIRERQSLGMLISIVPRDKSNKHA